MKSTSIDPAQVRLLCGILVALVSVVAFGRGEEWMPKPPAPPPVTTLTNAARYLEWKWRMDVTDPATGIDAASSARPSRPGSSRRSLRTDPFFLQRHQEA